MRRSSVGWILSAAMLHGCGTTSKPFVCGTHPSNLSRVKAVGREGSGNADASAAIREISALGPDNLIDVLAAMDDADPVALNWLRSGAEAIAERAVERHEPLPVAGLESFVLDRAHAEPVRRFAFEWLAKLDPAAPDRLIPRMLDDPSVEMRRDAVSRELDATKKLLDSGDKPGALAAYRKLFPSTRDPDQVDLIAKQLESLGEKADLTRHYGCLQSWKVIGPFDSTEKRGFGAVYPPETELKLDAEYHGKASLVRWSEHRTDDPLGVVDLNKALGKSMGAAAYAVAWVESSAEKAVHIRAGSPNALKIWVNGELVLVHDEYHHGDAMDQYRAPAQLKPGKNTILVKVCQNEQKEDWAQDWKFQLRVCDPTGGGVL